MNLSSAMSTSNDSLMRQMLHVLFLNYSVIGLNKVPFYMRFYPRNFETWLRKQPERENKFRIAHMQDS